MSTGVNIVMANLGSVASNCGKIGSQYMLPAMREVIWILTLTSIRVCVFVALWMLYLAYLANLQIRISFETSAVDGSRFSPHYLT